MSDQSVKRRDFMKGLASTAAALPALHEILSPPPLTAAPRMEVSELTHSGDPRSHAEPWFLQENGAWVRQLSQPKYEIEFEFNQKKVPMRDGVMLSANIWRPKAEGKFPVVYIHTAYNKSDGGLALRRAKYFVPRGYVFAAVDCRGRYDSDGEHYFYWHKDWNKGGFEGQDVHDSLAWLGTQKWSSGKVGMAGGSYLGFVQWMGAPLGSPYLSALVPYVSPDDHYDNVFPNGAFQLTNSMFILALLGGCRNNNSELITKFLDWNKLVKHLPLRNIDEIMLGEKLQLWQDFIDHPDDDHYWRFSVGDRIRPGEMGPGRYPQVNVPSLNITGWYDQVQQATINNYLGMVKYGPESLRSKHQLIVGPWRHNVGLRQVGDLDFGTRADLSSMPADLRFESDWLKSVELRWFDYWLKGIANGVTEESPVNIYVMGENRWRGEAAWPVNRARSVDYYLSSSGHANSRFGDGKLNLEIPATVASDQFVYDPEDPVPTYGGVEPWQGYGIPESDGPRDQRKVQGRNDLLVYTSEPAAKDMEVSGRIICTLFAASSAKDTDFTAKLIDVHPNGYAQLLREGIVRGRYRNSFKKQELLAPGEIYKYTIDLWSVSHVFLPGHKIQVEISSSNFPKYDRNPNTGAKFGEDARLEKANQTIYHGRDHPSHISLPVVS